VFWEATVAEAVDIMWPYMLRGDSGGYRLDHSEEVGERMVRGHRETRVSP
jgi:hypothetical protein